MSPRSFLLAATAFACLLPAAPTLAQDQARDKVAPTDPNPPQAANPASQTQPAPTQAATPAALDEPAPGDIIVTARKRQESILKVPVVANVLTEAKISDNQVVTLEDVTKFAPGFVLGQSVLENGVQVSIRGVGTTSLDPGIDQSVSLVVDGMQFTQGNAYTIGLFDMAQVEVLKGPQALFFGKNSPGGVVSIRTADPGPTFELSGTASYEFEDHRDRFEGVASGPVSDTLGLRFAGAYTHSDGAYFENTAIVQTALGARQPPHHFGNGDGVYLRGTAVFKPMPNFSARMKVDYSRESYDGGGAFQLTSCPDGLTNYLPSIGIPVPSFFSPNEKCKADHQVDIAYLNPAAFGGLPHNGTPYSTVRQVFGTLELNYDLRPDLTLTSVTGHYDITNHSQINPSYFGSYSVFAAYKFYHRKETTEELRLASDFKGPFNFLVGGFYQGADVFDAAALPGNTIFMFPARLLTGTFDIDIRSLSGFVQGRYKLTPTLELAAGVRYTDEKRSIDMTTTAGGLNFVPTAPDIHSKNWSPEVTLTFTPTDMLTIFGSFKQAYKSGSYNIVQPIFPGTNNSYGDEKVQGGELGLKSRLADRQLNVNLAGYYYVFSGLQEGINQPAAYGIPVLSTVNAGSARVYGIDFDFAYRPLSVPGLSLNGAVNWNKAKFTKFVGAPCAGGQTFADGCTLVPRILDPANGSDLIALNTGNYFTDGAGNKFDYSAQNLTGTVLPRAPVWQISGGIDYELPMAGERKLRLGLSGQYSSKYSTNLGRRADFFQDAFAKINAHVTVVGRNNHWELSFIGNNLTDKLTTGTCFNANIAGGILFPGEIHGGPFKGPAGSDEIFCSYSQGRELWLRLTLRN